MDNGGDGSDDVEVVKPVCGYGLYESDTCFLCEETVSYSDGEDCPYCDEFACFDCITTRMRRIGGSRYRCPNCGNP